MMKLEMQERRVEKAGLQENGDTEPPVRFSGRFALFLASGLGAGYIPWAPGTAGTLLVGVPLGFALTRTGLAWAPPVAAAFLFLVGVWAARACERIYGRKDPQMVVLDEVVGFLIALPGGAPRWGELLAAFILFRAFDIFKPWPAGLIDRRLRGGTGVMLDDVVAGLYARLVLEVALTVLPATT